MKKYITLLFAGSLIGLGACGDNKNNTTQEQIDSTANARSATMESSMKAKNDSLINAMARMRADSAMLADSMARTRAYKAGVDAGQKEAHTAKHTHISKPAAQPAIIGNGKPAMGNGHTTNNSTSKTIGEGKPKMGEK